MVKGGRFPEEKLYRDVEARAFDRSRLKNEDFEQQCFTDSKIN